jgi:BirA family transcriptional regulator, biotin operon repressor / biotin---[acetyl-CoA-carboxylase] ligase
MIRAGHAPAVVRVGCVESTQAIAFALAAEGAADGTLVLADSQTAGRGRRGRVWMDEPGASLLASILLRPRLEASRLPLLSLAVAVAVAETLAEVADVPARLKWPNDVLVGGRKIAGILLESRLGPVPVVVVGIGVNLAQREFPVSLQGRATSVALESDRAVGREALVGALLERLERWRVSLEQGATAAVLDRWRALADTLGSAVTVDGARGVAIDVDTDGALLVADGDRRYRIVSGEIAEHAPLMTERGPGGAGASGTPSGPGHLQSPNRTERRRGPAKASRTSGGGGAISGPLCQSD